MISIKIVIQWRRILATFPGWSDMKTLLAPVDGPYNSMRAIDCATVQRELFPVRMLTVEPPPDDYGMVHACLSRQQHKKATWTRVA